MLINQSNLSALFLNINDAFEDALKDVTPLVDQIASRLPSSTTTEVYSFLQLFPSAREWLGERVLNNFVLQDIQLTNKKFEATAAISRSSIEDDKYQVFANMGAKRIAQQMAKLPDLQLAAAIEANGNGYDGVAFFDGYHPVDPSGAVAGTQSNLFSSTTSDGVLTLTAANVAKAQSKMLGFKGPDNNPLHIMGDTVMVPNNSDLVLAARQVANADWLPETVAGVSGTGSNVMKGMFNLVVNPYLTNQNRWYLLSLSSEPRPFIWQERSAPEFVALTDPQNEHVFNKDEFLYGARMRGVAGLGMWMTAIACDIA